VVRDKQVVLAIDTNSQKESTVRTPDRRLRQDAIMSSRWIAQRLNMGASVRWRTCCARRKERIICDYTGLAPALLCPFNCWGFSIHAKCIELCCLIVVAISGRAPLTVWSKISWTKGATQYCDSGSGVIPHSKQSTWSLDII
jgi:hypothetical protein